MKTLEKKFLTELGKSIREQYPNSYWRKIDDVPISQIKGMRFTRSKDFDGFWLIDELSIAIEAKALDKLQSFSMSRIRVAQWKSLWKIQNIRGSACYVVINYRIGPRDIRAYAIPFPDLSLWNRPGIPYKDVERMGISLPRISGGWNMSYLLDHAARHCSKWQVPIEGEENILRRLPEDDRVWE